MITLALDASTRCTGWSVMEANSGVWIDSGAIDLKKDTNLEHRICDMTDRICSLIKTVNPEKIYLEDTAQMVNVSTLKSLCWLAGGIKYWCAKHKYDVELVLPSVWRKYVKIQENRATRSELKNKAILLCQEQFDLFVSDDEAEAILINLAMAVRDYNVKLKIKNENIG